LPELNALENVALPMRVMVKKEESFRKARKFLKSIYWRNGKKRKSLIFVCG